MRRPRGSGSIRGKCLIEGCTRIQKHGGRTKDGQPRYKPYCSFHSKFKNIENPPKDWFKNNIMKDTWVGKQMIENNSCSICGWNKGPCDRHRIEPKKGYVKDNVQILCPNCHRLITLGIPF